MNGGKIYNSLIICSLIFISSVNSDVGDNNETIVFDDIFKIQFSEYQKLLCDVGRQSLISDNICAEQLEYICGRNDVLYPMLDASSKYSGVLYGKRFDYGNYDQCLDIDHQYETGRLLGKYCPQSYLVPDPQTGFTKSENIFKLSICIPDGCSLRNFFNISDHLSEELITQNEALCVTKENRNELGIGNLVTMSIFVVWTAIVISCTIYEVGCYAMEKDCDYQNLTNFSLVSNFKKLFEGKKSSKNHIAIFDGIRAISMMWIISFHAYVAWIAGIPESNGVFEQFRTRIEFSHMFGARLGVDTFFFISGYFVALSYLRQDPKPLKDKIYSVPILYLKRYIRLTASLLFVYLSVVWILPKIGTGPSWIPKFNSIVDNCKENWWAFFLYVQNYHNYHDVCIPSTWYLSADMQLFILSPIVLIPLSILLEQKGKVKLSMVLLVMLNILLTILPIILNYNIKSDNTYDIQSRMIEYTLGITLSAFMYKLKDIPYLPFISRKKLKVVSFLLWAIVLLAMYLILLFYIPFTYTTNRDFKVLYSGLSRPIWCIGLCWIIYSSHHGYGGIINWILTRDVFKPLSKLSYTMYLLHFPVIYHFVYSIRTRIYFSNYNEFYIYCGYFMETLLVSILFTLVFDYPIEKLLLQKIKKVIKKDTK